MSNDVRTKKQSMADLFGTDPAKERDGVGVQFGRNMKVLLARAGGANERFQKIAEEVTRPYRRMIVNEMIDPGLDRSLMFEVYARAVVLKWDGALEDDGETEIPFTWENVVKQFDRFPDFFDFVKAESNRLANYRKVQLEAEAGN